MEKWKWIYDQLARERDRLDAALTALRPLAGGRPKQGGNVVSYLAHKHKRGPMSAAARKRMSLAQKARWARSA